MINRGLLEGACCRRSIDNGSIYDIRGKKDHSPSDNRREIHVGRFDVDEDHATMRSKQARKASSFSYAEAMREKSFVPVTNDAGEIGLSP